MVFQNLLSPVRLVMVFYCVFSCSVLSVVAAEIVIDEEALLLGNQDVLLGANGVMVNGNLYDVRFVDGTCLALFDACDELADFPFSFSESFDAAQALLDQVLLDLDYEQQFDSKPQLTNGCSSISGCDIFLPRAVYYSPAIEGFEVVMVHVSNLSPIVAVSTDHVGSTASFSVALDTTDYEDFVWAVWSPAAVPVPAGAWLFLSALLSLAVKRKLNKNLTRSDSFNSTLGRA